MQAAIPIFEAKNKLPYFIHQVETNGPVRLRRHNKDVAVLISSDDYDALVAQAKKANMGKSFVERAADFRKRNGGSMNDEEIDRIFSSARNEETVPFTDEAALFKDTIGDTKEAADE